MTSPTSSARSGRKKTPRNAGIGANAAAKHREMLEVLRQFRVVIKSVRRHYQQVERRSGVSGAQIWALAHIADHPGCKVGELARALAVHPSTASNLVRRLESLGLATRKRTGRDQRTVQLHPSAKGLKALKHAPRPIIGVLQQALSDIPETTLLGLRRNLGALLRAMRAKDIRGRDTPISEM